jgi:uncharacterized protein with HEPN domain
MSVDPSDRLEHILDETVFLIQVRKDLDSKEDIVNDEILKRAIVRSIEIIGEATKNLPENIRQQNSQIDWKNIARMRDNLIHRYFGIDYDTVWRVLENKIPELHETVTKTLQSIYREQYLIYKQQIGTNKVLLEDLTDIDEKIAQTIVDEYPEDFRDTAIAKIERILGHSDHGSASFADRAMELKSNNNSIESYLTLIIESMQAIALHGIIHKVTNWTIPMHRRKIISIKFISALRTDTSKKRMII